MRRVKLSAAEARRVALAAQGFALDRPAGKPDVRHFRRVLETLGLLQLDYVNVLIPAHFLILWSRLGAYDRAHLERYLYDRGECIEQWAHEASILPASSWPLLEYRRQSFRMHQRNPLRTLRNRKAYLANVLKQVQDDGPVTAGDLPPAAGPKPKPGDWHRSIPRWALEYHFARGSLLVRARLPNFQRVFDLPERILPAEHCSQSVPHDEAQRELLRKAATAFGVATLHDLADYYRMPPRDAAPFVRDLVEDGSLTEVQVEGWQETAYLSSSARFPRSIGGASLLSPFDPVVWYRPRAERLFGFHYRIEIYVPAEKRRWGYYVLPFRVGDRIVARIDLKADRKSGQLLVLHAHVEEGTNRDSACQYLATELHALKCWLGLEDVQVTPNNSFATQLSHIV
jgi:uncharacterized protein YcaQ